MTQIYLVRHGETEWNTQGRYQGQLDSPLTELGIAQAKACSAMLKDAGVRFDALLASPLGRTRQTAAILTAGADLPQVRFDPRLAEVSTGSWDGLSRAEIEAGWPGQLDGANDFDWFFRAPDGESYQAAIERAASWLADQRGTVLAVSHGLFGRLLRGAYAGLPREAALSLPVPQDVIWHLVDGRIDAISAV